MIANDYRCVYENHKEVRDLMNPGRTGKAE